MVQKNKLDKAFGPVGTVAGIIVFAVGFYILFYSYAGIIAILIGAFVGFTGTTTYIDITNKRVKHSTDIFGIIRIGNWVNVEPSMKIGIKKSTLAWRSYSQSNRTVDIADKNYKIYLYGLNSNEIIPLYKAKTLDEIQSEIEKLSENLGIEKI